MFASTDLHNLSDPAKWVFPVDDTKATQNWNSEWGVEEDAKLVVGVWRHGHGNWEAIEKDETLGLGGKFFLEDAKIKNDDNQKRQIPNSIHLVRRADYLTHLLREYHEGLQATSGGAHRSGSNSNRPTPRPKNPHADRSHDGASSKSKPKRRATPDYSSSDESVYDSMDERECKEVLRPVKRELKRLKLNTADYDREQKLAHLKECLSAIGARIEYTANLEKSSAARDRRRKHLCESFAILRMPLADSLVTDSFHLVSQGFGRLTSSLRRCTGRSCASCE